MVKLDYFLICETVIRDTEGRLTLVNLFDQLSIPGFPAMPAKFALIFGIYPEKDDVTDGEISFEMQIKNPDGKVITSVTGGGKVSEAILKNHARVAASADLSAQIPLDTVGTYEACLLINGKNIAQKYIQVNLVKE